MNNERQRLGWDKYGLWLLTGRLNWIIDTNPVIYRLYMDGRFMMTMAEERLLERYRAEGYEIVIANNEEEIAGLRRSIEELKKRIGQG